VVESYDRDLTDIIGTQGEIAQTVASKLSAQLSPQERKDIEEFPPYAVDSRFSFGAPFRRLTVCQNSSRLSR
jgi:hypothetical protein